MKQFIRNHILPLFPLAAGIMGLLLRVWLFSTIDEKGLLPAKHFADTSLYILTAVTLAGVFLLSRNQKFKPVGKDFCRFSMALGCLLGGIGIIFTGLRYQNARFSGIAVVACLIGGLVLLAMAVLKCFNKKIPYSLPAILTASFMLDTVAQCQIWGAVSQLQEYFFPLMAAVFLILSAYHTTLYAAGTGKSKLLVFFTQSAIFFCCTCLNTSRWPLYLGLLFWVTASRYCVTHKQKEA